MQKTCFMLQGQCLRFQSNPSFCISQQPSEIYTDAKKKKGVFKVIPQCLHANSLLKIYRRKKRTVFKVIPHSIYANQQSSEFIIYAIKKKYKCWILSYFLSITAPCFYTIGPLIAGNYWVFVLRDLIIVYQPPSFGDLPIIKLTTAGSVLLPSINHSSMEKASYFPSFSVFSPLFLS